VSSHVPAVVVGGGISGLVFAHALREAGVEAVLLEGSSRTGGVIRSEQRDGFLLELGPQSFTATQPLRTLCADLGIERELVQAPAEAPRYVLVDGRLQKVPLSPPALLKSSLLGVGTKLSFLRDALGKSSAPIEDESIAAFVRRKFSAQLLDRLVGPFVSGIYAGDPERLSLRSAFPQVHEAECAAGSVIRGMKRAAKASGAPRERPTLMSFRDGTETLVRTLTDKLGGAVRTGNKVSQIARDPSGKCFRLTVNLAGNEDSIETDAVVAAAPTDTTTDLLRGVDEELSSAMSAIEYASIAVVSLGYRRSDVNHSLEGFGFLAPRSSGLRTLGTVWNSSLFPGRAPADQVLLTSFVGGATDPMAASLDPSQLIEVVHNEIAPILGIGQSPSFSNVVTYAKALPQYNLGHSKRLAEIERRLPPGLWLAGNYLRGPSVGACVEQAMAVVSDVVSRLRP
jgi:protoporphyrinogen/coproporphyrinogen III oxidase